MEGLRLLTLAAKAVESAPLPFQGMYDIEARHRLATAVFGIHDGITNDILKEDLEATIGIKQIRSAVQNQVIACSNPAVHTLHASPRTRGRRCV